MRERHKNATITTKALIRASSRVSEIEKYFIMYLTG